MIRKALLAGAMLLPMTAARADTDRQAESNSIWTIRGENDVISTMPRGSDQNYTSGQQIGWTSGTDMVPEFAGDLSHSLQGDGTVRIGIELTQQFFTPANKALTNPDPRDRPYAGYLAATGLLLRDAGNSRDVLSLSLGVIGPLAQAEETQNSVHSLIRDAHASGWSHQLPNEVAVELFDQRTWRVPIGQFAGLEADVLPALALGAGTVRDYAQASTVLRIGQGLTNDFGIARIRPGISGGDAYGASDSVSWYVFAGADGQAVARDAFLDGDLFSRSAHVQHLPLVGELEAGFGLIWRGVRLSYVQTWQTAEFRHQSPSQFNFGSLALSVRF